jgi:hypothetical protein
MHHMHYLSLYGALSPVQWVYMNLHPMPPSKGLMVRIFIYVLHISMLSLKADEHNINFIF